MCAECWGARQLQREVAGASCPAMRACACNLRTGARYCTPTAALREADCACCMQVGGVASRCIGLVHQQGLCPRLLRLCQIV